MSVDTLGLSEILHLSGDCQNLLKFSWDICSSIHLLRECLIRDTAHRKNGHFPQASYRNWTFDFLWIVRCLWL